MRLPKNSPQVKQAEGLVQTLLGLGFKEIEKAVNGYKFDLSKDEAVESFQREEALIGIYNCNGTKVVLMHFDKVPVEHQGTLLKCGTPSKFGDTYILPFDIETTVNKQTEEVPASQADAVAA